MASVSVVIPTWNRSDLLTRALESLGRQSRPAEEVIVVDNGSADDPVRVAEASGARLIRMETNAGFAAAVNRGVLASASEWLLILNNDVQLEPDWLERVLGAAEAAGAWFAVGKIYRAGSPGTLDGTVDLLARSATPLRCAEGRTREPAGAMPGSAWLPSLTAALVRRTTFERVGLLDERFESHLEDVDFGLRCVLAGLHGCYVPDAVAYHEGSATLGRYHPHKVRLLARNQLFLVAKHYPPGWWRRLGWPVLVGQLLWGCLAARHGRGLAFLRGKIEGLRRFGEIRRTARPTEAVYEFLEASERGLRICQQLAGYDTYWRLYFALT